MARGSVPRGTGLALLAALTGLIFLPSCEAKLGWLRRLQEEASTDSTWSSLFSAPADAAFAPLPLLPPPAAEPAAPASSTPPAAAVVAAPAAAPDPLAAAGTPARAPSGALDLKSSYSYMLSPTQRARGITYIGSAERLRVALSRAAKTKRLSVAVVGGSISSGAGAYDDANDGWVDRLQGWLVEAAGPKGAGINVTVNNGAVPGTTSAYMCACFRRHVPEDADVIFVEYGVNDAERKEPLMNNEPRRAFERLLRKLLSLPSRPAVVLLNAYAWFKSEPYEGVFWSSAEREHQELAWYYHLPTVSVKTACYEAMAAGLEGFEVHAPRERDELGLKGRAFYYDYIHPDGKTGHRVMAELAMHLLATVAKDVAANPVTKEEEAAAAAPLPRPMMRDNQASLHDACFVGPVFKDRCVVGSEGWSWVNEAKGLRPKWGYVATEPGRVLRLKLNTTVAAGLPDKPVLIQLAHLRSYEHMGWAEVSCASGCECPPTRFNGHSPERKSLLVLHKMFATQHPECVLAVEVLNDTDSGEHKVKLAGAIVSDQAGEQKGLDNAGAVEHVHDISFRHEGFGNGTVFDIRNHV